MKSTITHYQDLEADLGTVAKDVLVAAGVDNLVRGSEVAQTFVTLGPKLYLDVALAMCERLKTNLGLSTEAVDGALLGIRTLASRFDAPIPEPDIDVVQAYSEADG